jgi:hypothetical protein
MYPEKPWLKFTKENIDKVPEKQGVYEIAYVTPKGKKLWRLGKISNLHKRLLTRLQEPEPPENSYFRYYEAGLSEDIDAIAAKIFDSYKGASHLD